MLFTLAAYKMQLKVMTEFKSELTVGIYVICVTGVYFCKTKIVWISADVLHNSLIQKVFKYALIQ